LPSATREIPEHVRGHVAAVLLPAFRFFLGSGGGSVFRFVVASAVLKIYSALRAKAGGYHIGPGFRSFSDNTEGLADFLKGCGRDHF
jgi:hypothetical protein